MEDEYRYSNNRNHRWHRGRGSKRGTHHHHHPLHPSSVHVARSEPKKFPIDETPDPQIKMEAQDNKWEEKIGCVAKETRKTVQKGFHEEKEHKVQGKGMLRSKRRTEMEKIIDTNDDNAEAKSLQDEGFLVGKCLCMCPLLEIQQRQEWNDVHTLEKTWPNMNNTLELRKERFIKKYARAAAGKMNRPEDVLERSGSGLEKNSLHVDNEIDEHCCIPISFLSVYNFIDDRLRSIRQDFTVQHIRDECYVECLEWMVRFYAMCSSRVYSSKTNSFTQEGIYRSEPPKTKTNTSDKPTRRSMFANVMEPTEAPFNPLLHTQQFSSCLLTLKELYLELYRFHPLQAKSRRENAKKTASTCLDKHPNVVEMLTYDLYLRLGTDESPSMVMYELGQFSRRLYGSQSTSDGVPSILNHPKIKSALEVFVAAKKHDYLAFFRGFNHATYLEQCVLQSYIPAMWQQTLRLWNKAFSERETFALETLQPCLNVNSSQSVAFICLSFGVHVEKTLGSRALLTGEQGLVGKGNCCESEEVTRNEKAWDESMSMQEAMQVLSLDPSRRRPWQQFHSTCGVVVFKKKSCLECSLLAQMHLHSLLCEQMEHRRATYTKYSDVILNKEKVFAGSEELSGLDN